MDGYGDGNRRIQRAAIENDEDNDDQENDKLNNLMRCMGVTELEIQELTPEDI